MTARRKRRDTDDHPPRRCGARGRRRARKPARRYTPDPRHFCRGRRRLIQGTTTQWVTEWRDRRGRVVVVWSDTLGGASAYALTPHGSRHIEPPLTVHRTPAAASAVALEYLRELDADGGQDAYERS